eukprot:1180814-Prorocentrum_minimum.AAC.1
MALLTGGRIAATALRPHGRLASSTSSSAPPAAGGARLLFITPTLQLLRRRQRRAATRVISTRAGVAPSSSGGAPLSSGGAGNKEPVEVDYAHFPNGHPLYEPPHLSDEEQEEQTRLLKLKEKSDLAEILGYDEDDLEAWNLHMCDPSYDEAEDAAVDRRGVWQGGGDVTSGEERSASWCDDLTTAGVQQLSLWSGEGNKPVEDDYDVHVPGDHDPLLYEPSSHLSSADAGKQEQDVEHERLLGLEHEHEKRQANLTHLLGDLFDEDDSEAWNLHMMRDDVQADEACRGVRDKVIHYTPPADQREEVESTKTEETRSSMEDKEPTRTSPAAMPSAVPIIISTDTTDDTTGATESGKDKEEDFLAADPFKREIRIMLQDARYR